MVRLVGSRLLGLDEAVCDAAGAICTSCHRSGATVACVVEACRELAHWPCAVGNGWRLDGEDFQAWCPSCDAKKQNKKKVMA